MAFLDNSGDIILDAVLTDEGRTRLARGDGSFRVTNFALGDDEINYALYDSSAAGSALYDLNIMKTPILEAFTNKAISMNSLLMTLGGSNLLWLPSLKEHSEKATFNGSEYYLISTTTTTDTSLAAIKEKFTSAADSNESYLIQIDQGIATDSSIASPEMKGASDTLLGQEFLEKQYKIELDSRLGYLQGARGPNDNLQASYTDNNYVSTYFVNYSSTSRTVKQISASDTTVLKGLRGTRLSFRIKPSQTLTDSTFAQLGTTVTVTNTGYKVIYSYITISGVTTGCSISLPLIFVKKQ